MPSRARLRRLHDANDEMFASTDLEWRLRNAVKTAREEAKRKLKPKTSAEAEKPVETPAGPIAPSPAPIPSTKGLFDPVPTASDDSPATAKA